MNFLCTNVSSLFFDEKSNHLRKAITPSIFEFLKNYAAFFFSLLLSKCGFASISVLLCRSVDLIYLKKSNKI